MMASLNTPQTPMMGGHGMSSRMPASRPARYMSMFAAASAISIKETGVITSVFLFVALLLIGSLLPLNLVVLISLLLTGLTGLISLVGLVGLTVTRLATRTVQGE